MRRRSPPRSPRGPDEVVTLFLLSRVDCVDGVAAYLETVIEGIRRLGDQVVIVSGPVSTPEGSDLRRLGIERVALDWLVVEDFSVTVPKPVQLARILRFMRRHDVKVIAPQGFKMLPYARILSRLAGRLPVVAHYHPSAQGAAIDQLADNTSPRARRAYRAVTALFGADRYIAASSEIRAFFEQVCGIDPSRIEDQPFGINDTVFREPSATERRHARATLDLPEDALICVLPGRLNLVKGHDVAVEAVRLLRRRRPDLNVLCLFAGGGDQRSQIEAATLQSADDRVAFRFLGFISTLEAMRTVYWAADVCVLPSRFEGFAIAVVEAMACGAVPIRTPSGGHRDQIIDGQNGFIVPFNDAASLADCIEALGADEARHGMRTQAVAMARARFTQGAMAAGTRRLLRDAAGVAA